MHIPMLFCMNCKTEMVIHQTGALLEAIANWGSYYKVYSDVHICPGCDHKVAVPARTGRVHNQPGYEKMQADAEVTFSDNFRSNL